MPRPPRCRRPPSGAPTSPRTREDTLADLGLILVLASGMLLSAGLHFHWPGADAVRMGLRRLWGWVKSNPASVGLWGIVVLHWSMIVGLPVRIQTLVLQQHSTNLSQLRHDPLTVLISSAMWITTSDLKFATVLTVLVFAPAERWLGTRKWVGIFMLGHILTSILVATWLLWMVDHEYINVRVSRTVDVGVSYGAYCLAGLLCYRFRAPWRWIGIAGLVAALGGTAYSTWASSGQFDFTQLGHCITLAIGLALYPITRFPDIRKRQWGRWWRVPVEPTADPPVTGNRWWPILRP